MRISDWSSDVCSSDLHARRRVSRQLRELSLQHLFGTEERIGSLEHQPRGWTSLEQGGEGLKQPVDSRSEERRVGKECVSTCSSRRSQYHYKNTTDSMNKYQFSYESNALKEDTL